MLDFYQLVLFNQWSSITVYVSYILKTKYKYTSLRKWYTYNEQLYIIIRHQSGCWPQHRPKCWESAIKRGLLTLSISVLDNKRETCQWVYSKNLQHCLFQYLVGIAHVNQMLAQVLAHLLITAASIFQFELQTTQYCCVLVKMISTKNATILQHRFVDKSTINNFDTSPVVTYTLLACVVVIACCCIILVLLRLRKMCKERRDNFDAASTTRNLSFSK